MNKLLPFLAFSILLLVPVGAQNVFAGPPPPITSCTITPNMVNLELAPDEEVFFPTIIQCDALLVGIMEFVSGCKLYFPGFQNAITTGNEVAFEENVLNFGDRTVEDHCAFNITLSGLGGGQITVTQELWINVPPLFPEVGGELIPIDTIPLLLSSVYASMIWWLPGILIIGASIVLLKTKRIVKENE